MVRAQLSLPSSSVNPSAGAGFAQRGWEAGKMLFCVCWSDKHGVVVKETARRAL